MTQVLTRDEELLAESFMLTPGVDLHAVAAKSPTIVRTLRAAREKIQNYFGQAPVRLSLRPDPDIRGAETVVLEILPPLSMTDAFARQDRFDHDWWLAAWGQETADVCILIGPA